MHDNTPLPFPIRSYRALLAHVYSTRFVGAGLRSIQNPACMVSDRPIFKYSQEVPHRFKEDLRSELVFSLDAGHIRVSTSRQNSSMSKWHVANSYPIQSSPSLLESKYTMQVSRWKALSRVMTTHRFLLRWLRSRYLCGMPIFFLRSCLHHSTLFFSCEGHTLFHSLYTTIGATLQ